MLHMYTDTHNSQTHNKNISLKQHSPTRIHFQEPQENTAYQGLSLLSDTVINRTKDDPMQCTKTSDGKKRRDREKRFILENEEELYLREYP